MYPKEDQQQAKNIIENKPLYEFLVKYLIEPQQSWTGEVITMPSEQLGQMVKADVLAQTKIVERFNKIKHMAGTTNGGAGAPIAPK